MSDGDVVRKITISATGENVDSTRASTEKLSAAVSQLTDANQKNTVVLRDAINNHESFSDKALKTATGLAVLYGAVTLVTSAFSMLNAIQEKSAAIMKDAAIAEASLMASLLPDNLRAYTTSWARTNEILTEYIGLAAKAASLSVGTDFYQRETLAADKLKITNDSIIKQMETLNAATKGRLGGSTGQQRVDELVSFGNFKGNTGVDELKTATTAQEKYTAVLDLIKQAQAAGQDLAAIDIAKTFLGQGAADNLQKDRDYLDNMQRAAATMSATKLISDADVSGALDLQNRLIIAEDTISKKWFPTQRDGLNPLVMAFKEMWVEIVEMVAGAFSWVEKIVKSMLSIPASLWDRFQNWRHADDSQNMQAESPDQALARGQAALRVGMQNPNSVLQSTQQASSLANQLRPDTSKSAAPTPADTAAYNRATESILRYIEVTKNATLTVSDNVGEQEKYKVIAQLTAAAEKDKTPITAALTAEMTKLGNAAGAAGLALAKAKMDNSISFGSKTSLLSPDDVAIANQLKGIYPDVATALGSVQAAGIRTNTALSGLSSTMSGTLTTGLTDILDGTKSVGQGFTDMSKLAVRAIEEMIVKMLVVGPLMRGLQGGLGGMFGGGASVSSGTSLAAGTGGLAFPMFANGTDNAPGGWSVVGENGPELMNVPKGASILPNGVSPGGGGVNAPVMIHIDATGADAAGLARVQSQLAMLRASLPATIVKTVQKAKTSRIL